MAADNELYNQPGDIWWDEREHLSMLRTMMNPARLGFFREVLIDNLRLDLPGRRVLDVGCGGGILAEELAGLALSVTGVDPSFASVTTARNHARQAGLPIEYLAGAGERLPFASDSYDIAVCSDVLEHVDSVSTVIGEISRVLKEGGVFLFETINRTLRSRIAVIGLFQKWKWTSCAPPDLHDWNKFIKPREMRAMLARNGFEHRRTVGLQPRIGKLDAIRQMRKRRRGEISQGELGRRLEMRTARDISMSYIGWAVKCAAGRLIPRNGALGVSI
jgi:2-polyprenyl-6-hydroxyphenyl methylase/3-demethylubiquinone-9 3-methyltransferase